MVRKKSVVAVATPRRSQGTEDWTANTSGVLAKTPSPAPEEEGQDLHLHQRDARVEHAGERDGGNGRGHQPQPDEPAEP
ncbi:MAG: hypothetical protein QM767_00320, partial [Anaeromyxobacter sp.]